MFHWVRSLCAHLFCSTTLLFCPIVSDSVRSVRLPESSATSSDSQAAAPNNVSFVLEPERERKRKRKRMPMQ